MDWHLCSPGNVPDSLEHPNSTEHPQVGAGSSRDTETQTLISGEGNQTIASTIITEPWNGLGWMGPCPLKPILVHPPPWAGTFFSRPGCSKQALSSFPLYHPYMTNNLLFVLYSRLYILFFNTLPLLFIICPFLPNASTQQP